MAKLTVLSFGGGQDSTALLYEYAFNPEFRKAHYIQNLIVVMSNTGNEHPETYKHVNEVAGFCEDQDIPFYFLDFDMGFHPVSWNQGLIKFYERTSTVGSKAFKKSCTDNLKIKPIYDFLNHFVIDKYDLLEDCIAGFGPKTFAKYTITEETTHNQHLNQVVKLSQKNGLKLFAKQFGKIDVMIGIAAGEESRISTDETSGAVWMRKSVRKLYPLVDLGWDRAKCQEVIAGYGKVVPPPSNCILCPFMSLQELLFLYRFHTEDYYQWVELEKKKIEKYAHLGEKNVGVWGGKKMLPEVLEKAIKQFGHLSDQDLKEYKMSHGHCVKSKY